MTTMGEGSRADGRRTAWLAMLMVSTALATGGFGVPALAQQAQPRTEQPAQATRIFNIPAQSLTDGLTAFGQQSGWQVSVHGDLIRGASTSGVSGTMTPQQALEGLLAGTGFTYVISDGDTVTLQKLPQTGSLAPNAIQLGPLRVEGQTGADTANLQSPYGPGVGYVATQSVTGTKSDTPIIETPQSISVVTGEQIDDQKPQTLNEVLRYTPGIVPDVVGVTSNSNNPNLLLRGFNPDIYLDGLKTDGGDLIDPYFLSRVEVLSGPASVLYGQASPGGIVNMSSKLPTEDSIHELQLGVGNYGRYQGAFDFGGPIDEDGDFLYRVTGVGFSENTQTDFSPNQEIALAPAITWRPDSNTTFTLLGDYTNRPSLGSYAGAPAQGSVLPNPNGKISTSFFSGDSDYNVNKSTYESIGYKFEHQFSDVWIIRQNFRFAHNTGTSTLLDPLGIESDLTTLDRYAFQEQLSTDSILLDNQVQAKIVSGPLSHTILAGIDYQHYHRNFDYGFNFTEPAINIFSPVYGQVIAPVTSLSVQDTVQDQVGIYAQDQMRFGQWAFLLGGRQDWANSTTSNSSAGTTTSTTSQSDSKFTWRAGAVYLFDNGLAPYASYSTSFQPQVGASFSGTPFRPTTGEQYEVGIKYQPPGANSFVTGAAYNLTQQNVLTTDPEHFGFSLQSAEIRARGVELQGHANLNDSLSVIATYTYTDAVNTKSNSSDTGIDGVTTSEKGKVPIGVPSQMASLWADYTLHDGAGSGLGFGGGVRYVGPSYGDDVNSFKVPSFTLFDAAVHYDLGAANRSLRGLSLRVNATNLFDRSYVSTCNGAATCYFGARRTIFATLSYDW